MAIDFRQYVEGEKLSISSSMIPSTNSSADKMVTLEERIENLETLRKNLRENLRKKRRAGKRVRK